MTDHDNEPRINVAAGLAWSALVLAAMIRASLWAWDVVPGGARVPTHWNERGEIDGYWSKANGLTFAPTVAAFIALIFAAVPILGRRRKDLMRSRSFYYGLWAAMMIVFAAVHAKIVAAAVGVALPSLLLVIPIVFIAVSAVVLASSLLRRARHA
jgi:hypothetical protein